MRERGEEGKKDFGCERRRDEEMMYSHLKNKQTICIANTYARERKGKDGLVGISVVDSPVSESSLQSSILQSLPGHYNPNDRVPTQYLPIPNMAETE